MIYAHMCRIVISTKLITLYLLHSLTHTADQHYSASSWPCLSLRDEVGRSHCCYGNEECVSGECDEHCDKRQGQIRQRPTLMGPELNADVFGHHDVGAPTFNHRLLPETSCK